MICTRCRLGAFLLDLVIQVPINHLPAGMASFLSFFILFPPQLADGTQDCSGTFSSDMARQGPMNCGMGSSLLPSVVLLMKV